MCVLPESFRLLRTLGCLCHCTGRDLSGWPWVVTSCVWHSKVSGNKHRTWSPKALVVKGTPTQPVKHDKGTLVLIPPFFPVRAPGSTFLLGSGRIQREMEEVA